MSLERLRDPSGHGRVNCPALTPCRSLPTGEASGHRGCPSLRGGELRLIKLFFRARLWFIRIKAVLRKEQNATPSTNTLTHRSLSLQKNPSRPPRHPRPPARVPSRGPPPAPPPLPLCGAYPFVGYCGSFLNKLPLPKKKGSAVTVFTVTLQCKGSGRGLKRADRFVQRASAAALAGLVELDDVRQGRREVDRLERGWSHNDRAACAPAQGRATHVPVVDGVGVIGGTVGCRGAGQPQCAWAG